MKKSTSNIIHIFQTFATIIYVRNAATHETRHCHTTTHTAHFPPGSLLIEEIAATHGVYRSEKTRSAAAEADVIADVTPFSNRTPRVDTTLSFAIKPDISAVHILQSPSPTGAIRGARNPATFASMLLC